jgi:arginyl-tRNA synthetase
MLIAFKRKLKEITEQAVKEKFFPQEEIPAFDLEVPSDKENGDFSTNIALKSAKALRKSPLQIAKEFCPVIEQALKTSELSDCIGTIQSAGPGFINFRLSRQAVYRVLYDVFQQGGRYGCSDFGNGKKVQIEFVSSNPTGPLTIAHARQAAVGDVLANILDFTGFDVKREYYVNDGGNQITMLGKSIFLRAKELLGESVDFPDECYQGAYIKDMAGVFLDDRGIRDAQALEGLDAQVFKQFGVSYLMDVIRQELDDFGVHFDIWSYESQVAHDAAIKAVLAELDQKGMLYKKDGALWFRSTAFGDDKDRVVQKSDGLYTYLTPDIAYHKNKYDRGFDKVYNIWGPDHHGYIPRIKAAVQALGRDVDALEVLIVQLATIYRDGQPVSMSTRKGEFISLREVLTEVGKDAARFFFLMRGISAHLDFDLDLAKKETPENPVYYIQYAHARIHSIVEKAKENGMFETTKGLRLLQETDEMDLIKTIGGFQEIVEQCTRQMEPLGLLQYLQELAACFHRFYDHHRVIDPSAKDLSCERLALIDAARIVLANGLRLLGVSTPEKM